MTPMLAIIRNGEPHVLYGPGAKFAAEADGIITLRPVGDHAVSVRVPRRATTLRMQGGETLTLTVAAGDIIELV
ncbi:hypothetical protein [Mesorhizobium sp.]|uniref:hypothetical protein n=1 Tax=Mesorhizobium sp. TaxID=1871066 RepID=UPI000FE93379|nr:hypothetical protein [Mesorhizobium sp.]RWM26897.1 MAG: hypothetical protein EOR74_13910 [Mesorhizobium sp.]